MGVIYSESPLGVMAQQQDSSVTIIKKKAALALDERVIMFKNATIFSKPLAILEKGRLCLIAKCKDDWCKIKVENYSGWVKKESLWGNL